MGSFWVSGFGCIGGGGCGRAVGVGVVHRQKIPAAALEFKECADLVLRLDLIAHRAVEEVASGEHGCADAIQACKDPASLEGRVCGDVRLHFLPMQCVDGYGHVYVNAGKKRATK